LWPFSTERDYAQKGKKKKLNAFLERVWAVGCCSAFSVPSIVCPGLCFPFIILFRGAKTIETATLRIQRKKKRRAVCHAKTVAPHATGVAKNGCGDHWAGETLGPQYNIHVGSNKTKQHTPVTGLDAPPRLHVAARKKIQQLIRTHLSCLPSPVPPHATVSTCDSASGCGEQ